MTKILALYYSGWGHMQAMTKAAAVGARDMGAEVSVKRVRDLEPTETTPSADQAPGQDDEIADPLELTLYDGFIIGVSTRLGMINAPLKHFFEQTFPLWGAGALIDKPVTVMSSSAYQHGGVEAAILSTQAMLQHHGMLIIPLTYSFAEQMGDNGVLGGSPYGMTSTTGNFGECHPSAQILEGARYQGQRLARIATKLIAE